MPAPKPRTKIAILRSVAAPNLRATRSDRSSPLGRFGRIALFDLGALAVLCTLLAGISTAVAMPSSTMAPNQEGDVPLHIVASTRNDDGRVYCAIWSGEDGYPTKRVKARYEGRSDYFTGQRARLTYWVQPGHDYAVACFHDEDDDKSLDTNLFGIPSEGTGASNDAPANFGPPSYSDAVFSVSGTTAIMVPMHY